MVFIAYYLSGAEIWTKPFVIHMVLGIGMYIVALNVSGRFRKSVEGISNNYDLFDRKEVLIRYRKEVVGIFNLKIERVIPISSFVTVLVLLIVSYGVRSAEMGYSENLIVADGVPMLAGSTQIYMVESVLYVAFWVFNIAVFADCMILLINYYKYVSSLGQSQYPLSIDYSELQSGVFAEIGKDILTVTLPIIITGTLTGIVGLFDLFVYNQVTVGYFLIGLCIGYDVIVILMLYKETVHIHKAIIKFKKDLIERVYDSMNRILDRPDLQPVDYENLYKVQLFLDKVEEINDWPFNASSVKKLLITALSSIVPLVLSVFGINL